MKQGKFKLGNTVLYSLDTKPRYRITGIHGKWFGTNTYDITSIKSTTAQEKTLKEVPENFLRLVETVSG